MEMPSGGGVAAGLGLLGPALVLRPPPDADHVVAGDGHHVLVVVATSDLHFKHDSNNFNLIIIPRFLNLRYS